MCNFFKNFAAHLYFNFSVCFLSLFKFLTFLSVQGFFLNFAARLNFNFPVSCS